MSKKEDNNKIKPQKSAKKETTKKSGKKDIEKSIENNKEISNPDKPKKKKVVAKDKPKKLTEKEKAFCREYVKNGNGMQSVRKAGYSVSNDNSASARASILLRKDVVRQEITRLNEKCEKKAIMDAQEVMELFSAVARGEIKDQFGLDATLADRLKAMNEIAKRTIDIDNRIKGVPDGNVVIKVDWRKS